MATHIFFDEDLTPDDVRFIKRFIESKRSHARNLSDLTFGNTARSKSNPILDEEIIDLARLLNLTIKGLEKIMLEDITRRPPDPQGDIF